MTFIPSTYIIFIITIPIVLLLLVMLLISRIKRFRKGGKIPERWTTVEWFALLAVIGLVADPTSDPDMMFVWRIVVTVMITFIAFKLVDATAAAYVRWRYKRGPG